MTPDDEITVKGRVEEHNGKELYYQQNMDFLATCIILSVQQVDCGTTFFILLETSMSFCRHLAVYSSVLREAPQTQLDFGVEIH